MGALSDAKKAYRLLKRALASRTAVQRVRRRLAEREPLPADHFKVAVYFADGAVNMYQMRQWYRPLAELSKRWPVVVLSRQATGTEKLLEEDSPPVAFVPKVRDMERFIATQDIRLVLYVNQNTRNFQMFRYGRRWHVFINHGESDKMYMTTNQYKAYDYAFVAGQAARDRLSRTLWDYDVDRRTIEIGRPQADHYAGTLPYTPDERTVVLYAPTWEETDPARTTVRSHRTARFSCLACSRPAPTVSSTVPTLAAGSSTRSTEPRTDGSWLRSMRRTRRTRTHTTSTMQLRNSVGS